MVAALRVNPTSEGRTRACTAPKPANPDGLIDLSEDGHSRTTGPDDEVDLWALVCEGRRATEQLTAGHDLLPGDRRSLLAAVRRGDRAAGELVQSKLGLVMSLASRHPGAARGSILDLVHEGNIGLFQAVKAFEPDTGTDFAAFAVGWIREAMDAAPSGHGCLDRHGATEILVGLARNDLAYSCGATPPTTSVEDAAEQRALEERVIAQLVRLDAREQMVIRLRYGLGAAGPSTLQAVGDQLHLTRERVRQLEARALAKMRRGSGAVRRQPTAAPLAPGLPPSGKSMKDGPISVFDEPAAQERLAHGSGVPLTRREVQVLGGVASGMSNRAVSEALFITTKTVACHLHSIFTKLGAGRRSEAVAIARAMGIISTLLPPAAEGMTNCRAGDSR